LRTHPLSYPWDVAWLLDALDAAGARDPVEVLLARDPAAHVSLHDSGGVAGLLRALARVGASDAVAVLAARAGAHAGLDHPAAGAIANLEKTLREAGASDAADVLAARAAALHSRRDKDDEAARSLYVYGREPGGSPSPPWTWQDPTAHAFYVYAPSR
jgi:hypothetical protein